MTENVLVVIFIVSFIQENDHPSSMWVKKEEVDCRILHCYDLHCYCCCEG